MTMLWWAKFVSVIFQGKTIKRFLNWYSSKAWNFEFLGDCSKNKMVLTSNNTKFTLINLSRKNNVKYMQYFVTYYFTPEHKSFQQLEIIIKSGDFTHWIYIKTKNMCHYIKVSRQRVTKFWFNKWKEKLFVKRDIN